MFALLWVIWALFIFIGLPLQQVRSAQSFATYMYSASLDDPAPKDDIERAQRQARQDELWENASWSHVYKSEVLPNIWLCLGAAILVPVFVYAVIRGLCAIFAWLYRGFTSP
ncbi:MAG: hypothetical protein QM808_11555 [Steroidobacteraceae bacterium]